MANRAASNYNFIPRRLTEEMPNQHTRWVFLQRSFGKKTVVKRSFHQQWFLKWWWLHYDVTNDVVFCHRCVKAVHLKRLSSTESVDLAFISLNWKDAAGNTDLFASGTGLAATTKSRAVQVMYIHLTVHYHKQKEI